MSKGMAVCLAVSAALCCGAAQAEVDSAAPRTWWHWMNGNVSKEGITADLEAMAAVGYTSTLCQNHPATPKGRGFEADKFDARAMARHFDAQSGDDLVRERKRR